MASYIQLFTIHRFHQTSESPSARSEGAEKQFISESNRFFNLAGSGRRLSRVKRAQGASLYLAVNIYPSSFRSIRKKLYLTLGLRVLLSCISHDLPPQGG